MEFNAGIISLGNFPWICIQTRADTERERQTDRRTETEKEEGENSLWKTGTERRERGGGLLLFFIKLLFALPPPPLLPPPPAHGAVLKSCGNSTVCGV